VREIWKEFTHGKQTHTQIAQMYGRSTKWVQRQLKDIVVEKKELAPDEVVIVMDTTYFKRLFGVMVWRCPHQHKNLLWKFPPTKPFVRTRMALRRWKRSDGK